MQVESGCMLCPRRCSADRKSNKPGYCGADGKLKVARAALHFWEEPPISGTRGSGTVFFSHCPLKCVYCQNRGISSDGDGLEITVGRLTDIFFELREAGAHNVNLVSPTQYTEEIIAAVRAAKMRGFDLPIVWNTGGYESVETLRRLRGIVDIYLTDFKYHDPALAKKYSAAADYPTVCADALAEMVAEQPTCVYDGDGIMQRGVIVRHLVLPGHTEDSKDVLDYVWDHYGKNVAFSLMSQYTPQADCPCAELRRPLSAEEYADVVGYAELLGMTDAFVQDGESVSESFIPKFDYTGVMPKEK